MICQKNVHNISTALQVFSFACSFLRFSVGPLNIGTPLMSQVLSILGATLKWDGAWDKIIQKMQENDPNAPIAHILAGLAAKERNAFAGFIEECLIPLIKVLPPVLQERHQNLNIYQDFFKYLNTIIQGDTEIDQNILEQQLSKVMKLMLSELKEYGPQLDAAFQALLQIEPQVEVED